MKYPARVQNPSPDSVTAMVGETTPQMRASDLPDHQMLVHEWEGNVLGIRVTSRDNSGLLEIARLNGDISHEFESDGLDARKFRRAATIALELDATLARLVGQGRIARLEIRRSRATPPSRPRNAEEAMNQRPCVEELIAPLLLDAIPGPPLRPFQEFGVEWLAGRPAGILADDMGLGKTVQALRALEKLVVQGTIRTALVVCPKSLLANWEAECLRWVPELTAVRVVPPKDESDDVWSAILSRSHIIITSYEQLRRLPNPLASARIELVIADEAHRLRRSQAKLVKVFRLINAERIWALTGTPIERHEGDLATLLSLLEPARFSAKSAATEYLDLKSQARPYLLRRLKDDVLEELPDVIDKKEVVDLTPQQHQAYVSVCSKPFSSDKTDVLSRLTLLRSICDMDPTTGASTKLDRAVEILETIRKAGEKAVVFSYLLQPLNMLAERLARMRPSLRTISLTGELSGRERERVLRDFKSDESIVALLCSSRVGGEGLTLTEANHVIFINEWWNPSTNAQSRDRVVRIGQERIVHVHRFRCRETIEEVLDRILSRKNETFSNIVDALAQGKDLTTSQSKDVLREAMERFPVPAQH